jgi:hypothetical protein
MEPQVAVRQISAKLVATGTWTTEWEIRNLGAASLKILAARFPHGKFRGEEREFTPAIDLGSKEARELELEVRCEEPAGTEVENAFLILRVLQREEPWLILARLRVRVSEGGAPATTTELITAQRVGFSSQR